MNRRSFLKGAATLTASVCVGIGVTVPDWATQFRRIRIVFKEEYDIYWLAYRQVVSVIEFHVKDISDSEVILVGNKHRMYEALSEESDNCKSLLEQVYEDYAGWGILSTSISLI